MLKTLKRKIFTMFHTPRIFMRKLVGSPLFSLIPDKYALRILYRNTFLRKLNLKNPCTFNEKLQWLKLYDRRPQYTIMVDKYAAKQYAASKIGEEYIIPTYGVWDSFDKIDFNQLPNSFVLKCTHGSGDVVICRDKAIFDFKKAKEKLTISLRTDYYKIGREWPYKNVPRKIIAEKYMIDESGYELKDYKFFTFSGKVKMLLVARDRGVIGEEVKFDFYNTKCEHLSIKNIHPNSVSKSIKINNYEKMINLVEKLCEGLPHARIDLYNINGNIYFGEYTFYHGSGFMWFKPDEWNIILGSWLTLE